MKRKTYKDVVLSHSKIYNARMIERAHLNDVNVIYNLCAQAATHDKVLARTKNDISESIRDFFIKKEKGQIVGIVALHLYTDELSEIRTLCVLPKHQKKGIAHELIQSCLQEAKTLKLKKVFVLTYLDDWFKKKRF